MAWVGKKYKLDSSENFDEYMKELGQYIYACTNNEFFDLYDAFFQRL